jgi:hypothetical protein
VLGHYKDCKYYEKDDDDSEWQACMYNSADKIFAEKNVAKMPEVLAGGMWRRGTFNKDYRQLVEAVVCFVNQSCHLATVLKH